jgi:hypothetical protein
MESEMSDDTCRECGGPYYHLKSCSKHLTGVAVPVGGHMVWCQLDPDHDGPCTVKDDPDRIPVLCATCDPPAVVYVVKGTVIAEPYVCTCCQQRALKRVQRATEPHHGRMKHGGTR